MMPKQKQSYEDKVKEILIEIRTKADVSIEQAAKRAGIRPSKVKSWEGGKHCPSAATFFFYTDILGRDVNNGTKLET